VIFVDVILPFPLSDTYTFEVPDSFQSVEAGYRVVVQFGKKKIYTAIVYKVHGVQPEGFIVKSIIDVVDFRPIVNDTQLRLWKWIADYYCCSLGEVMNVALPSFLKLSSETIFVSTQTDFSEKELSDQEFLIFEALQLSEKLSLKEIESILDTKNVFPVINELINRQIIEVQEELSEKFKPKSIRFVELISEEIDYSSLKNAKKQVEILNYLSEINEKVSLKKLISEIGCSYASLKSLESKEFINIYSQEINRIEKFNLENKSSLKLSDIQSLALEQINEGFSNKDVVLLHGVTASGKTEIYIKLIQKALSENKQVLYLLPEIALTAQIINRLRLYFGDNVGVYHSKYNNHERLEVWSDLSQGKRFSVIIGTRSSLFLPFQNLGLIIVDEEHENSFKQYNPNPRYHARDCSVVLANFSGAKVLFGSATPSIESYYNAKNNKYSLVELHTRYNNVKLPKVEIIDLKYLKHRKLLKSNFSDQLLDEIGLALEKKEQVIIFQNRRGFAPVSICQDCGWIAQCKSCDVSLTYHKHSNLLKCHYCGYSNPQISSCQTCGSTEISVKGMGTEKIEEELGALMPKARIKRMDLDTTSKKNSHQDIITNFENRNIDILIGTQMVTKGLDFDNVSIVGVINADNMLNFPDFRSHERSFDLMVQVSGRAGRKDKQGKVIVQTYSADHEIIDAVKNSDFLKMYNSQLAERKLFDYPPYFKLIQITVSHRNNDVTNQASRDLAIALRKSFGSNVLGPEYPLVSRVKNKYLKNILLKIDNSSSNSKVKSHLLNLVSWLNQQPSYKSVRVIIDVDPI
jgi:primosomal protein N' (replication factor Y)